LIILVLGAAVYVGAQAKSDAQSAAKIEAGPGSLVIGRDAVGTTIIGPASK
jgi:hypothetical protein